MHVHVHYVHHDTTNHFSIMFLFSYSLKSYHTTTYKKPGDAHQTKLVLHHEVVVPIVMS